MCAFHVPPARGRVVLQVMEVVDRRDIFEKEYSYFSSQIAAVDQ